MPLHVVQPELKQHRHRVRILNTLGDCLDVALLRGTDYLADRILHRLVGHQGMHQFTVDLDVVRFEQVEYLKTLLIDAVVL